jgi:Uma2 family endonuclease
MVQVVPKPLTLAEFLELPETKPASEFINGTIIQKPMPQVEHSVLQGELLVAITAIAKPNKIAGAFPELRCTFDNRAIVPDIAVFQWSRIPRNDQGRIANRFDLAPDWTIEILSPDQSQNRVARNILHCIDHGTEMGWLIDPYDQLVIVYYGDRPPVYCDQADELLPSPSFLADFKLTVGEMFAWLLA